ncbi:MAG: endonuclease III [Proteobacteria bacterium]|nr:endonuclease III [Desulfobacteraceae bacterium]MBU4053793.1 endonuclease III [Pseudomonadota bacterium]MBU4317790.1 endonuclease III [Pseudomonadota bacterium]MBU4468954.1 endonuclease III [Pseudomonadota bacterium]
MSTLLSLRTKDEVTLGATLRLFDHARTPRDLQALSKESIEKLIYPVGFYHTKADRLLAISRIILEQYDGNVPDDMDKLLALPGVGRKTANLVLAEGFGQPAVCVDTHVHRISNRIGFVETRTPEKTEFALREKLPRKYWIDYNEMLVALGQTICRPISPFCSRCPASGICPKIGVDRSR